MAAQEAPSSIAAGARVYQDRGCVGCHGPNLDGQGIYPTLVGRAAAPDLPTTQVLFDYVRRRMPYTAPGSLTDEETYSVVAYLLNQNGLLPTMAYSRPRRLTRSACRGAMSKRRPYLAHPTQRSGSRLARARKARCSSRERAVAAPLRRAAGGRPGCHPRLPQHAFAQAEESIGPQRIMRNPSPLLLESPVDQQTDLITPNELHFVRQHFDIPTLDAASWQLSLPGMINAPVTLRLAQLPGLPIRTLTAFTECSGNSRGQYSPRTTGNGAISVANWTGLPLATLLDMAGLAPEAASIVGAGADSGRVCRAIPREKALDPDTLVAYARCAVMAQQLTARPAAEPSCPDRSTACDHPARRPFGSPHAPARMSHDEIVAYFGRTVLSPWHLA